MCSFINIVHWQLYAKAVRLTACDGDQEWAAHEKSAINKCANLLFPILYHS